MTIAMTDTSRGAETFSVMAWIHLLPYKEWFLQISQPYKHMKLITNSRPHTSLNQGYWSWDEFTLLHLVQMPVVVSNFHFSFLNCLCFLVYFESQNVCYSLTHHRSFTKHMSQISLKHMMVCITYQQEKEKSVFRTAITVLCQNVKRETSASLNVTCSASHMATKSHFIRKVVP